VTAPTTSYNYDLVASPAVSSSFNWWIRAAVGRFV